ncbi:MAG: sugar phosphate isomerase/epimerase [Verrucomicrobiales bacterium]|nr:sugar phosphate isomerase/epimerase [Verrucomicrobiales bacterium]
MSHFPRANRRRFLKATAAGVMSAPFLSSDLLGASKSGHEICTFTKPLQHLSYAEMAKVIAEIGFDGIEAPVRPRGHVLPEKVEEDLPRMIDALKDEGLSLTLLTSGINEVSAEQHTEKVLRTAAGLGVKRFRMAYYKYDLKKPIAPQMKEFRPKLKDLVALSKEVGIKPIYQNHSGRNYFGGPIWDLAEVLEDFDPADVGVAFDIGHATVEGAKAWPLNFARIRRYIDMIYVKEPGWKDNKLEWGPVGSGCVDQAFYDVLKKSDFSGPISLHVEYLGHKDPKMVPTILEAMKKDYATLQELLS